MAPILAGWVLVGEIDKYVPMSKIRFGGVSATANGISVQVMGLANESVKVCAAAASAMSKLVCVSVGFTAAGTKSATFPPAQEDVVAV